MGGRFLAGRRWRPRYPLSSGTSAELDWKCVDLGLISRETTFGLPKTAPLPHCGFLRTKISRSKGCPRIDSATPRSPCPITNRRAELRWALNPKRWFSGLNKLIDQEQVRLTEIFSDEDVHRYVTNSKLKVSASVTSLPRITLDCLSSPVPQSRGDACSTVVTKSSIGTKTQGNATVL